MTRTRMLLASVGLLGALGMLASPAAFAADTGTVVYAGSGTVSSGGQTRDVPVTLTMDCTYAGCTVAASISADGDTISLTPGPVPIEAGENSWAIAASGDPCAQTWLAPGTLTIALDGEALTGSRVGDGSGEVDCGDGETVEYSAYNYTFAAVLSSGDPCLITGACPEETATPEPTETAVPIAAPEVVEPEAVALPSALSALPTAAESASPGNLLWAAAGAIVLVILVALPSHLLSNAIDAASDRLAARWGRTRAVSARLAAVLQGWPIAAAAVAVAALVSSFIDPAFGFTAASLRVFLSILVSFALEIVLSWVVLIWLVRRARPGLAATFKVVPLMFLVVIGAVLFSRLTGFEPGLITGGVAGVVFGALAARGEKARVTLVSVGWAFGLGVIAWIAYSVWASTGDESAVALFARETLAAMAIGGIVTLPVALVPLPGLAGRDVYVWNRAVWAGCYALGLAAFLLVLLPLPASWDEVPVALPAWIGVVVAYAVVATAAWLLITKPWVKEKAAAD